MITNTEEMFQGVSNKRLVSIMTGCADRCVSVLALPAEERRKPGPKGEAGPEQSGWLSALFASAAQAELERREACRS